MLTVVQSCFIVVILLVGSDLELQMVLLDTVSLCGNTDHDFLHDQPKGRSFAIATASVGIQFGSYNNWNLLPVFTLFCY